MPVNGVLLALHGAMVAEGELDAEENIVAQVRALVGGTVPIVVLLDMHGNISPRLVELADVLLAYHTNPQIDAYVRGVEAAEIMAPLLSQELQRGPLLLALPCCCRHKARALRQPLLCWCMLAPLKSSSKMT